jgi:hypothetical protein
MDKKIRVIIPQVAVSRLLDGTILEFKIPPTKGPVTSIEISLDRPDRFDSIFDRLWNKMLDKFEKL